MEQIISNGMKKKVFEFSLAVYRVTDLFPVGEVLKRQTREIANELLREISELEAKESIDTTLLKRVVGKMLVVKNFLLLAKYNNFVRPVNVDVLLKELSFFESFFLRQLQYQTDPFWQEIGVEKKNDFPQGKPENEGAKTGLGEKTMASELADTAVNPVRDNLSRGGYIHPEEEKISNGVKEKIQENIHISEQKIPPLEKEQEESFIKVFGQKSEEKKVEIAVNTGYSERQRAILDYLRAKKIAKANDLAVIFSNRFSLKTLQRDLVRLIENKAIERKGDKRWATYIINEKD